MNIAIRVDASTQIGSGHVMRCLTLANVLRRMGNQVVFICREHSGNLCDYIESKAFMLYSLPLPQQNETFDLDFNNNNTPPHASWLGAQWKKDADETISVLQHEKIDCLVVDHFGIDASWERKVKKLTMPKIAVIDGQLDRPHDCDYLLDPNITENASKRWRSLVPSHCELFIGPKYSFIRPEFIEARRNIKTRDGRINRLLVAFGGTDKKNATELALKALKTIDLSGITVDVVASLANPNRLNLKRICHNHPNIIFHLQPSNLAELMAEADLALGAGGTMAWERCYLGLPTIIIAIADNQDENCRVLSRKGAGIYLGKQKEVTINDIVESFNFLLMNPSQLSNMVTQCKKIMGDSGTGMKDFCKAIML